MTDEQSFIEDYATALGEGPSPASLARQRAKLVWSFRDRRRSHVSAWAWGLTAPVVAILLVALLWHEGAQPTASRGGQEVQLAAEVQAGEFGEKLEFSDGSEVRLSPGTTTRLERLDEQATALSLGRGQLEARVTPRTEGEFSVQAGPYRVVVVGTAFRVSFDEDMGRVEVEVEEGTVRVEGPGLPAGGQRLQRGQTLTRAQPPIRADERSAAPNPNDPSAAKSDAESKETSQTEIPESAESANASPERATQDRTSSPPATSSWRALARDGKYVEAIEAASDAGTDGLLIGASPGDLLLLGNAARFAGDAALASRSYRALRSRFSGTTEAALAAYSHARLALDASGDPEAAIRWLRIFLEESPGGELAATARARLMTLLAARGEGGAARKVASDYLRLHPHGPHERVARSLLSGNSP